MSRRSRKLVTPIYLKTSKRIAWPKDISTFYLMTGSGLFLCRNHPFFTSCVPARDWPSELAEHKGSLKTRYPKIPRRYLELVIGFFDRIARLYSAEAAVVLVWDTLKQRVRLVVPKQVSHVTKSWSGRCYPLSVEYDIPALPAHYVVLGDVHCHVDGPAYSSYVDQRDETHRAGLHVVVGRIEQEPPQFHVEAVVDGVRFEMRTKQVLEGYHRRRLGVPPAWIRKLKVKVSDPYYRDGYDDDRATTALRDGGAADADDAGGNGHGRPDAPLAKRGNPRKQTLGSDRTGETQ